MDHPVFVRIEYWSPLSADWEVGHAGINLMDPATYVKKLAKRGTLARAVVVDTGEIVYSEGGELL